MVTINRNYFPNVSLKISERIDFELEDSTDPSDYTLRIIDSKLEQFAAGVFEHPNDVKDEIYDHCDDDHMEVGGLRESKPNDLSLDKYLFREAA